MADLDFSGLTDDQLIELIRAAATEAVRRGPAMEAAAGAVGLDAAEKARVADAAARRATEKIRKEEEARIAVEVEAKLRAQQSATQEAKARDGAAKVRALAVRARELFGSDVDEFNIKTWKKGADKRLYIGQGYGNNWVTYHHTGSERFAPGYLEVIPLVAKPLAAHLGITQVAAKKLIEDYCREICTAYETINLDVSSANAPCDPNARADTFWITGSSEPHKETGCPVHLTVGGNATWHLKEARIFDSREEAEAEILKESTVKVFVERDSSVTRWRTHPNNTAQQNAEMEAIFLERFGVDYPTYEAATREKLKIEKGSVRVPFPPKKEVK